MLSAMRSVVGHSCKSRAGPLGWAIIHGKEGKNNLRSLACVSLQISRMLVFCRNSSHVPQECMLQTVHTISVILPTLLRERIGYKMVGILMLLLDMTVSGR